jgi:hypothetical protein
VGDKPGGHLFVGGHHQALDEIVCYSSTVICVASGTLESGRREATTTITLGTNADCGGVKPEECVLDRWVNKTVVVSAFEQVGDILVADSEVRADLGLEDAGGGDKPLLVDVQRD